MVDFKEFARRFGNLPDYVLKQGRKILKENEQLVVDLQTGQHHAGVNKMGTKMQSGYSPQYGKRRKKAGLQTSFVDLHFTGKMHEGSKVLPAKGGVDVRSKEPYEYYVRANFPHAWGMTKPNAETLAQLIADRLAKDIKKFLVA